MDARLQSIEDFLLIMNIMGGPDAFVDFELRMRRITGVGSPLFLDSRPAEQTLLNCLLGFPAVTDEVNQSNVDEPLLSADERTRIRIEAGIGDASVKIIQESLQDGVRNIVLEQMETGTSSSMKKNVV